MKIDFTEEEVMLISVALDALVESLAISIISMEAVLKENGNGLDITPSTVGLFKSDIEQNKQQLDTCKNLVERLTPYLDQSDEITPPSW